VTREPLLAVTSLSPSPASVPRQQGALQSWRAAGLVVHSLNHPSEIGALSALYDVRFVPVAETTEAQFGRPYVPIKAMLDWAAAASAPVLLVNSDIELRLTPSELYRLRWLGDEGLFYFVRFNHDGDPRRATPEPWGIDAFLFHGRHASVFPDSFLSMGQPFWDYWLPLSFAARGRPVWAVESPVTLHADHGRQWSWENWHRCALEFDRLTGALRGERSLEACVAMSQHVRADLRRRQRTVPERPGDIRRWVEQRFAARGPKVFLELGAHQGLDTAWLARIPDVVVHAFEPDPRNQPAPATNVVFNRAAIADEGGRRPFILSREGWGREWTYSSSLMRPKNHLLWYPVTFGETIEVDTVRLDTYCRERGLGRIDFIWADIQGAEGEMVRGGLETLARTRYLYTEFSDHELYEGQATLSELMALLPDFRVIELWDDDVLLENTRATG
jgi:FkbM family methyltransferase